MKRARSFHLHMRMTTDGRAENNGGKNGRAGKRDRSLATSPHPQRAERQQTVPELSGPARRIGEPISQQETTIAGRGWLIPIGGQLQSDLIVSRFVDLCGERKSHIVIIPTASDFGDAGEFYGKRFRKHGVRDIATLTINTRRGAFESKTMQLVEHATGIFFTGGNQLKLSTMMVATPLGECLRKKYLHGMHVAGTSAGAAILSRHMIAFGEEGNLPKAAMVTTSAGLGFTERFIIDQHFRERNRLGRLLTAVAYNPGLLGLGVDEDTAAFISPADCIDVVGSGGVTLVDSTELDPSAILNAVPGMPLDLPGMQVHLLEPGSNYDARGVPVISR